MSFFVSDALKGRITEENLLDEKEKNKKLEREIVYVSAKFENFSHDFKFVSFKKEKSVETLTIEVHESYRYLSTLLKPDSKFIVTKREPDDWFNSVKRFFGSIRIPFHKNIYHVPCAEGYEKEYKAIYNKHNTEVLEFFNGKDNFLLMESHQNFNYKTLCTFLNIEEIPHENFPQV